MNIVEQIERINILMYKEIDQRKRESMRHELRMLEMRLNQMAIWGEDVD